MTFKRKKQRSLVTNLMRSGVKKKEMVSFPGIRDAMKETEKLEEGE